MAKTVWCWQNERCLSAFRDAIVASDSAGQVAILLDKEFLPSKRDARKITRNVVIGGVRRPNVKAAFARLYPSEANVLLTKFEGNISVPKKKKQRAAPARRLRSSSETVPVLTMIPFDFVSTNTLNPLKCDGHFITVESLEHNSCRFPIGDPSDKEFAFCGRAAFPGPYCVDHARLSYRPARPAEAALAKLSRY